MSEEINKYVQPGMFYTPYVVGYLIKENKVLLGIRKKVSSELGANIIAGIGGHVGDHVEFQDETYDQALIREYQEEVAITPTKFEEIGQVRFIFPHKPKWNQDVKVYVISEWKGEPQETEVIKPVWYDISDLPVDHMWDDAQYWLTDVLKERKHVDMVFLYNEENKIKEFVSR